MNKRIEKNLKEFRRIDNVLKDCNLSEEIKQEFINTYSAEQPKLFELDSNDILYVKRLNDGLYFRVNMLDDLTLQGLIIPWLQKFFIEN